MRMQRAGISTLVVPPAVEPVSIDEAKSHLRIDHPDGDAIVSAMLASAREAVELETRRALIWRTLYVYFNRFEEALRIPHPPLSSVSEVAYRNDPNEPTWATLDSDQYYVDTVSEPGFVVFTGAPPSDVVDRPNSVRINCIAGYGNDPEKVPVMLRQSILFHVQAHYDNDPATLETLTETMTRLLAPYRVDQV